MRDLYSVLKKIHAKTILDWNRRAITDPTDPDYGFVRFTGGPDIGGTSYYCFACCYIMAYYLEGTETYHNPIALERGIEAWEKSDSFMYEDGTIDLHETNMHDPTCSAFTVRDFVGPIYEIMTKYSQHTELEDKVFAMVDNTLRKMTIAMETLGFHTPNHRWIICSALLYSYNLLGDKKALDVIDKFLWEGLDCDENGEYTERSTGMYNVVCDRSFLQMYHFTRKKEYLDCVDRNLKLMRSFYEPDSSMCTMNSMRQDVGYSVKRDIYYDIYVAMALYTKDPEYGYYVEEQYTSIEVEKVKANGVLPYGCYFFDLYFFLVEPDFIKAQSEVEAYLPERNIDVFLKKSGMVRLYNDNTTLSLSCGKTPDFMKFMVGSSSIYVRGGASFFGQPHAQFRPHKIEKTDRGYKLIAHEEAGYRSQLDEPPATSEWRLMDHSKRKLLNIQTLDSVVEVIPTKDGFELEAKIECSGCVPFKLEFQFVPNLWFSSDIITFQGKADNYMYYKGGKLYVRFDNEVVYEITGGAMDYTGSENMRGTEHVRGGSFTLCVNSHTPCTLKFAMKKVDIKQNPNITKAPFRY
ncbi:MAG: hypothetical protein MJ236_02750 [Clostridia bacterium]|nr:hypothetical protein [Clostridia bacterium]